LDADLVSPGAKVAGRDWSRHRGGAQMTVDIRHVRPADEHLFERIAAEVFDHAVDLANLARYLAMPGHLLVVAIADGQIVGQVAAVVHRHPDARPTELYIDEVAVTPALQRQGIATRMLEAMFALGLEHGCQEAWLGTERDNLPAQCLYERRSQPPEPFVMYVFRL
jgi:aminoglycoside 6'-N-acetyltransferase I